jgi:hypothetical protein
MFVALAALFTLFAASISAQNQKKIKKTSKSEPRNILNFDGGIFFETDGSLSSVTCFRLQGRVTAPQFFDRFLRIDDADGTHYQSGVGTVTEFPDELRLIFRIYDEPCPAQLQHLSPREYLTPEILGTLRMALYWKHGVELRPLNTFTKKFSTVIPIQPYNTMSSEELPARYEWSYEFTLPGTGVPLTDSLIIVLQTADGRVAARVAGRL